MAETTSQSTSANSFDSFDEFYPFYLSQHSKKLTRYIHVAGTALAVANAAKALVVGPRKQALLSPVIGYGFAWVAHFMVEGNKPATFGYPAYSLRGDITMMYDIVRGRDAALQQLADSYQSERAVGSSPIQPEPTLADSPDSSTASIDAS